MTRILFIALLIFCSKLFGYSQNTIPSKAQAADNVGDIVFDSSKDNPSFYLCNSKNIPQYYQVETSYKGGVKKMTAYFSLYFKPTGTQNGFVTIRFIVNCKGETDRFRVFQIDRSYNKVTFDAALTDQLVTLTRELKEWIPGSYGKTLFDSYYHLTFKLENGKIATISP